MSSDPRRFGTADLVVMVGLWSVMAAVLGGVISEVLLREVEVPQMKEAVSEHKLGVEEAGARSVAGLVDNLSEEDRGGVPVADPVSKLGVGDLGNGVILAAELSDGYILRAQELHADTEFIRGLGGSVERLRRGVATEGEREEQRTCRCETHGDE